MLKAFLLALFVLTFSTLQSNPVQASNHTEVIQIVNGRFGLCYGIPTPNKERIILVASMQEVIAVKAAERCTEPMVIASPPENALFVENQVGEVRVANGTFRSLEDCFAAAHNDIVGLLVLTGIFQQDPNIQLLVACIPAEFEYNKDLTRFMHEERERTGEFPDMSGRRANNN